jgi:hypothetical protein
MRITLTLPSQGRRVGLRSFWLALGSVAMAPWLVAGWWFDSTALRIAAMTVAILFASTIIMSERLVWRVYRAWNSKVVRPFSAIAARAVTRATFLVLVAAGVPAGTRLHLALQGPALTAWTPRGPLPPGAYGALFSEPSPPAMRKRGVGWIPEYLQWARRTGNLWSIALVPFLAILRLFPPDADSTPQANIYTLF